MGNIPLPSPPTPTPTTAVLYITARWGALGINGLESLLDVPDPLAPFVSEQDFQCKMSKLSKRLRQWRAGRFTMFVGFLALVFVLLFVAAVFLRGFWNSVLFDNPFYVVGIASAQVILFCAASCFDRRETRSLIADTLEIFLEWRPNVRTSFRQVNGAYPGFHEAGRCPHLKHQRTFFAIIFDAAPDREDTMSAATADTFESDV